MKEVYLVNTCDIWMSYDSFRLVGIFTCRRKLNPVLVKLLKEKAIEFEDDSYSGKDIKDVINSFSEYELKSKLSYISIDIITLNQEQ